MTIELAFRYAPGSGSQDDIIQLVETDQDIPVCVEVRPGEKVLVVNSLIDGKWGEAASYPVDLPVTQSAIVGISVEGDRLALLLNEEEVATHALPRAPSVAVAVESSLTPVNLHEASLTPDRDDEIPARAVATKAFVRDGGAGAISPPAEAPSAGDEPQVLQSAAALEEKRVVVAMSVAEPSAAEPPVEVLSVAEALVPESALTPQDAPSETATAAKAESTEPAEESDANVSSGAPAPASGKPDRVYRFRYEPATAARRVSIDLLVDRDERSFHISLRGSEGQIVTNEAKGSHWQQESSYPFPFDMEDDYVISIEQRGAEFLIRAESEQVGVRKVDEAFATQLRPRTILPQLPDPLDDEIEPLVSASFIFEVKTADDVAVIDVVGDPQNIPIHVGLIAGTGISINARMDGAWSKPVHFVHAFETGGQYLVCLDVRDGQTRVLVNGVTVALTKAPDSLPDGWRVYSRLRKLPQPAIATTGELMAIGGGQVGHVRRLRPGWAPLLQQSIPQFLLSRAIDDEGVILDVSGTEGAASVILRRHFPRAAIICVAFNAREQRNGSANLAANGCADIQVTSPDVLASALSGYSDETAHVRTGAAAAISRVLASPVSAIFAGDIFGGQSALDEALLRRVTSGEAQLCALGETAQPALTALRGAAAKGDYHVRFRQEPWALRKDRLGVDIARPERLDISVAMYNSAAYIKACIGSLLAADREDIRVIVVDDGSTDTSAQVVRDAFGGHPRLRLVSKANGGCASARNYGRTVSDAAYIAFVDADDMVDPEFFPALLDVARLTGGEVVQGGFELHDSATSTVTPSYEKALFADRARIDVGGHAAFSLQKTDLLSGQPTIWRRIYRRDFLDSRAIAFPEHVRSFDDLTFHIETVYLARDIWMVDGPAYQYRQHAAQDIRQGDERHFHELDMFRMLMRRAVREGWNDFHLFAPLMLECSNWSIGAISEDLVAPFMEGLAEIFVMAERCWGAAFLEDLRPSAIQHPDFGFHLERVRRKWRLSKTTFGAPSLDGALLQPSTLAMMRRLGGG
jgi:glycosyltransferase involved in cell wall biosynthesis